MNLCVKCFHFQFNQSENGMTDTVARTNTTNWSPEMTIQGNPGPTTNEANNCVPSVFKLCYYLATQIWKLVFAALHEVYYGYV